MGVVLSFCKFTTVTDAHFVGLDNFRKMFVDDTFMNSLWFTVKYAVVCTVSVNFFAFGLALLLTRKIKGTNVFRTILFMPNLIGGIVLGWIWQVIINGVLLKYNATIVTDPKYGFWGLVCVMNWQSIGYNMIIYIAGIQNISSDLLEAAEIDGAGKWVTLKDVIIPSMMSTFTICLFLSVTNGFKLFDQNLALTAGDPGRQTEMLALNIVNTFYGRSGFEGVGQAKALVFTVLVAVIAFSQLKLTRSREVEA
jgi:raffinose/stachyose/melibiose transport system permease protein